ncbi:hypothetical protein [Xenorhabdus innexi]|uniref:Uncharacterized protein n=1 Tax=Xenorhabdus innexi TaxID=290109 RepID=A0A1N6MZE7_9GAMM|nr:hypothetical protein [Xenorhabdus innexi]PHM29063.1 hypothetical protein Xinn_03757 [Xenorhabdus innexi]SIP74144.1 hypothetical protein XIS1_530002 [Xenorhabdus innexi]
MPDLALEAFFRELEKTRNPNGTPVLCEHHESINQNRTRTLTVVFENEDVRHDLRKRAHLILERKSSASNSLPKKLHQLGFEHDRLMSSATKNSECSVYKLTNHSGYDVTLNAYKTVILPSFSPLDPSYLNRFKERMTERKYQHIRDSLRNYQSPVHSPARSPQPGPSGLHLPFQQVVQQAGTSTQRQTRQIDGAGSAFHPYRRPDTQSRQNSGDSQPGRIWRPWEK